MRRNLMRCITVCAWVAWAGSAVAQNEIPVRSDQIVPSVPGQIGTSMVVERNGTGPAPRVGVLAYCTDEGANAETLGLMSYQRSARTFGPLGDNFGNGLGITDGGWGRQGQFGAKNLVDMLKYDDGIPRFRDVVYVDADRALPTSADLARDFDCVIAFTDNKCGVPIPSQIANSAASALAGFAQAGKGVVLTGFAFSTSIGFGNAIFGAGLSPLRRGGPGVDTRCSRPIEFNPLTGEPVLDADGNPRRPCPIGTCDGLVPPDGTVCTPQGSPALCLDSTGSYCGLPNYAPFPATADFACDHMLALVDGPTASSWATALTTANVDPTATLCFNYNIAGTQLPLLAINQRRNVVAVNTFPPDANDINKFWYQCLIGNAVQYACGNRTRCTTTACH